MRNHFVDEEWVDFGRGLVPEVQRVSMQRHLDQGCEVCSQVLNLWKTVAAVAARESGYESDPERLGAAQEAYAEWRRRAFVPRRARLALLVSDSGVAPLPSGIRTEGIAQRRIVYRLGRWVVDLQLETEPSDRLSVAGQLLRAGKATATGPVPGILVLSGDSPVVETAANEFGEFNFSLVQAPDLRLYFDIPGHLPICVPLTGGAGRPLPSATPE